MGVDISKRLELESRFFHGLSFQVNYVPDGMKASEAIVKLMGVKSVWPVQHHTLPDYDTKWTGTKPSSLHPSGSKRDITRQYPPHVMTQIGRLRADGITGSGIKIAIIDTGVGTGMGG